MVVITIICTIARQRPEYINIVLEALETLNGNLPPTLGTSQVATYSILYIDMFRLNQLGKISKSISYDYTNILVSSQTDPSQIVLSPY